MVEGALQSQTQGEGHETRKSDVVDIPEFFSQVKTETATTPQLNTFVLKEFIVILFGRNY